MAMDSVAEALSMLNGVPINEIDGGFLVKETEKHTVEVMRMIYNWRITRTSKAHPEGANRAYCYYGNDFVTLLRAVSAALEWDAADDTSPEGFDKNAMTEEYASGHMLSGLMRTLDN